MICHFLVLKAPASCSKRLENSPASVKIKIQFTTLARGGQRLARGGQCGGHRAGFGGGQWRGRGSGVWRGPRNYVPLLSENCANWHEECRMKNR